MSTEATPKKAPKQAEGKTLDDSPRRNESKTKEEVAAEKIQALARGAHVRNAEKDKRLWQAWNELDWKEESELMESHSHYESMKSALEKKRNAEKKDGTSSGSGATETFTIPVSPKKEDPKTSSSSSSSSSSPVSRDLPKSEAKEDKKEILKATSEDDGLTLSDPIQLDFVTAMMDHFKANKVLDLDNVLEILKRVKPMLAKLPNVVNIPVNTRITVVGDLHGQLDDLLAIFKLNGLPSPRNSYVFNGDFVDRGQYSCECILILLAFKLLYPKFLHLNRGNHEARDINSRDGFEKECIQKYNSNVFDIFSDVFAALPLACMLEGEKKVFVVHGGLFWDDLTIPQINEIKRFHEIPPTGSHMEQMLWSDPDPEPGRQDSPRGASLLFGPDVTEKFMADNGVSLIVRSHECMQQGFEKMHNDTLITVFSASNYCKSVGNDGAFVIFEKDMTPKIVTFYAKPKERLSRYRMRHALLENDIISKLLQRISDNRLGLVNYYRAVETKVGGIGTVTRQQWAEGLKKVLKLNIPFLEFQDYLGLPKLGVDGKKKGVIDHMAFLLRFKPVNTLLTRNVWRDEGDGNTREVMKSLESINEVLYRNRYELESLFRHFDINGDDKISIKEFKEGILSLQGMLENKFTESEVDALVRHIDMNNDGHISYSEFFASFQLVDPKLAERQAAGKRVREGAPSPSQPQPATSSYPSSPTSSASNSPGVSPPSSPTISAKKEEKKEEKLSSPSSAKKGSSSSSSKDDDDEEDDDEESTKPSSSSAKKRTTGTKNGAGKKKGAPNS